MSKQIFITEHDYIKGEEAEANGFFLSYNEKDDGLLLNKEENEYHRRKFFEVEREQDGVRRYRASYVIGAQRIKYDGGEFELIITPKIANIDFIKMFSVCFESGIESKDFSKIYGIDFESEPIKTEVLDCVLDPLLVVHFLAVMKKLVKRGLRNGYVDREENLRTVKGKIDIQSNTRTNIIPKRYDRIYCRYQEFCEDTPENRLLKKALMFSKSMLARLNNGDSIRPELNKVCSYFANVSENISPKEVTAIRKDKIYKEYHEAVRLAKNILLRNGFIVKKDSESKEKGVPPFWIDMSLLFEHYVLGMLTRKYGKNVKYQQKSEAGVPDFILKGDKKAILDTKYIDGINDGKLKDNDYHILRQLSGYSRSRDVLRAIGAETCDVPCVVIYPDQSKGKEEIGDLFFDEYKSKDFYKFFYYPVRLPMI